MSAVINHMAVPKWSGHESFTSHNVKDIMHTFQPSPHSLIATNLSRHADLSEDIYKLYLKAIDNVSSVSVSEPKFNIPHLDSIILQYSDYEEDGATPSKPGIEIKTCNESPEYSKVSVGGDDCSCSRSDCVNDLVKGMGMLPVQEKTNASVHKIPFFPEAELSKNNKDIDSSGDHLEGGEKFPVQVEDRSWADEQTPLVSEGGETGSNHSTTQHRDQEMPATIVKQKETSTSTSADDDSPATQNVVSQSTSPSQNALCRRYKMLVAENRRLKKKHMCRQCQQKPANMTLLPCGHLAYCEECAEALSHCGLCQKKIVADVRTFLC